MIRQVKGNIEEWRVPRRERTDEKLQNDKEEICELN
jgi:hypothetical protein